MTLGSFLVNRRTNRRYRLDGCRRSRIQPLLDLARPFLSVLARQQLPNSVDLRSYLSPIEEQYNSGSCVGNALASILEYFYYYTTGHVKTFSRLFIYYNARMMEDETSQRQATEGDSGADIQFAIVSLMKYGCCEEQYWPFYEHLINAQPAGQAYENGYHYRVNEIRRLSNNVNQLQECLAEGYPFIMAIKLFPSFASDHRGYIPMPGSHERPSHYRHAVVCVGYVHSQQVFIIRNSHGIQWGDRGYGYLPYAYVMDNVLTKDLWAIKSVKNMLPIPSEQHIAWSDTSNLVKSGNPQYMIPDQANWDFEYPNDDYEHEDLDTAYHRAHSQELPTGYAAAPVQQDGNPWMQPALTNNYSLTHFPSPGTFPNAPLMAPFPHYSPMFGAVPYFRPF